MNLKVENNRTKSILNNIALSLVGRIITTLSTFLIVPITIDYINPTQYGIWLTLSSIIAWVAIFDMGLGQGFRNRFSEAMALGNERLAREYVSTTYISLLIIVAIVYIVIIIFNSFVDWSDILNVEEKYQDELSVVFLIVGGFFCMKMVVGVFGTLLTADQKPGIASLIQAVGNLLSLLCVFVLTKTTKGSLVNLALYYSGIPCFTLLFISIFFFLFYPRYSRISPKLSCFKIHLVRNILSLGVQFFIIHICMIVVFQLTNIIISREIGPLEVTKYNISYKYFNLLYIVAIIIVNPFWSAFTEAYTLKDYSWMKRMIRKLEYVWIGSIIGGCVMLICAPIAYKIWIGDKVMIDFCLNLFMYIFYIFHIIGAIYMYLINGIGTIRIQLILYILFAVLAWPILVWSCRQFGVCGILIIPSSVYACQALLGRIQLFKLMNNKANGIWKM